MYAPHRASILRRPHKEGGGRANVEHADVEWAKEQGRLQAKMERAAAVEERLVGAFYATHEERRQAWGHTQREAKQLAMAHAAAVAAADNREAAWLAQPQLVVIDTQRPWSAASSTYYMPREVEEAARRRGQCEASEFNRYIAQRRAAQDAQQRVAEQDAVRHDYQAEDTFFNRGAASERWIPPEHRIKHRSGVPPQFALAPPPYCCDTEDITSASPATALTPIAAGTGARRPATSSRRAQEGQDMVALLRHDAPPAPSGGSFSGGYGSALAAEPTFVQARPQTAPTQQQQQRQYPWSWGV